MKIAVCLKQVVTRDWPLRVAESGAWVRDTDATFEMNEPDAYALEEALRLKERHGDGRSGGLLCRPGACGRR